MPRSSRQSDHTKTSWPSGLAKTISQGTVKGGKGQGRQKKKWEDNIRERTGLEFAESIPEGSGAQRKMEWRELVVKSSVVPQRYQRLRDE